MYSIGAIHVCFHNMINREHEHELHDVISSAAHPSAKTPIMQLPSPPALGEVLGYLADVFHGWLLP